jgi:hypothetical protein
VYGLRATGMVLLLAMRDLSDEIQRAISPVAYWTVVDLMRKLGKKGRV